MMCEQWKTSPSDLKIADRMAGVSGFMRLKNEEAYLDAAIESHLQYLDELVLVYNNCSDSTPEICRRWANQYPDKVKVFEYEPYVFPVGTKESLTFPSDNIHTLSSFYNYSLVRTTRTIAIKIDGDHIAVPDVFETAVQRARTLSACEWLSLRGANLFEYQDQLYISDGYGRSLKPKAGRAGGTAPITGGDHAFFMVQEDTWHEMDPDEGYEILRLHRCKDRVLTHRPVAFLHLKGVKHDKGMANWELGRYQDSIRQKWHHSVTRDVHRRIMKIGQARVLYPSYFKAYPEELLSQYGIHLKYAACTSWDRFAAHFYKIFFNQESKLSF